MRRPVQALLAATAGLLLVAGLGASPAEATARPTLAPSHAHGTETSMPGMDHEASPMPSMPETDHNGGAESRPRALLLGGFGGLNGIVLITAFMLRRRKRARHR